jgi:hypothetical protein
MRQRWRCVPALAGLVVAVGFGVSSAHAESSPSAFSARLVQLINQARADHGLRTLTVTSGTSTVASAWTERLDQAQALSHNPDLGSQLESHGSPQWTIYGENVGDGPTSSADTLFNAYMNSPEHRDNILGSRFRYLGIGVVFDGSTAWNTLDFVDQYGTPAAHSARPAQTTQTTQTTQRTQTTHKTQRVRRSVKPAVVAAHPTRTSLPATSGPVRPAAPRPVHHRPVQQPSVQALTLPAVPAVAVVALPATPLALQVPQPRRAPLPVLIATAAVIAGVAARFVIEAREGKVFPRVA